MTSLCKLYRTAPYRYMNRSTGDPVTENNVGVGGARGSGRGTWEWAGHVGVGGACGSGRGAWEWAWDVGVGGAHGSGRGTKKWAGHAAGRAGKL